MRDHYIDCEKSEPGADGGAGLLIGGKVHQGPRHRGEEGEKIGEEAAAAAVGGLRRTIGRRGDRRAGSYQIGGADRAGKETRYHGEPPNAGWRSREPRNPHRPLWLTERCCRAAGRSRAQILIECCGNVAPLIPKQEISINSGIKAYLTIFN